MSTKSDQEKEEGQSHNGDPGGNDAGSGNNTSQVNQGEDKKDGAIEVVADVDTTVKPASKTETVNLLDDEDDNDMIRPTEGDVRNKKESDLGGFRSAASESSSSSSSQPSGTTGTGTNAANSAQRQAESWVKILDILITNGLKMWSGQADNVGLTVSEPDKKVLAEQIALLIDEYKLVTPVVVTVLTTFIAMYAPAFMNAKESKKKIEEFKAKNKGNEELNVKTRPEFNPKTRTHIKKKGGQYKI